MKRKRKDETKNEGPGLFSHKAPKIENPLSINLVKGWFLRREYKITEIFNQLEEYKKPSNKEDIDENWLIIVECLVTKNIMEVNTTEVRKALENFSSNLSSKMHKAIIYQIEIIEKIKLAHEKKERLNLENQYLSYLNLSGAKLGYANLKSANFTATYLNKAELEGADLSNADFSGANLTEAILIKAQLQQANLTHADLHFANLSQAILVKAILKETIIYFADLTQADLTEAHLEKAQFNDTHLNQAILIGASLNAVSLMNSTLEQADFSSTDLSEGIIANVQLKGAKFLNAKLIKTNVIVINFEDVYLSGADFQEASLANCVFKGNNLLGVNFAQAKLSQIQFDDTILVDSQTSKLINFSGATFFHVGSTSKIVDIVAAILSLIKNIWTLDKEDEYKPLVKEILDIACFSMIETFTLLDLHYAHLKSNDLIEAIKLFVKNVDDFLINETNSMADGFMKFWNEKKNWLLQNAITSQKIYESNHLKKENELVPIVPSKESSVNLKGEEHEESQSRRPGFF